MGEKSQLQDTCARSENEREPEAAERDGQVLMTGAEGVAQGGAADCASPDTGDSFLEYLTEEYRKYRVLTLVMAIVGFSLMLVSIALVQSAVVSVGIYNLLMSIANLFIVLMLVIVFTRTRPYRKRIRAFDKDYVSIVDPQAEDGVRIEQRELPDMDDFYKIFERQARTELVPETDEYARLRRVWVGVFAVAAALVLAAVALYFLVPEASVVQTLLMIASFIMVIVAFYLDRTKMKPLRNKWARDVYGMGEFKVRDNMRTLRKER